MDLDPISYFLQTPGVGANGKPKRLELSVFVNIHSRLSILQMNKGFIAYDDLLQCLQLTLGSTANTDPNAKHEMNAYAGIIYEACFEPLMLSRGPGFMLNRAMIGNEGQFLKAVLIVLIGHNGRQASPIIEELKAEIAAFLTKTASNVDVWNLTSATIHSTEALESRFNTVGLGAAAAAGRFGENPRPGVAGPGFANNAPPPRPVRPPLMTHFTKAEELAYAEETRALLHIGNEIEKNEAIIRLLAHIRKAGMDIMFPQILHDKILMCIFVAMRCARSLAHRELIDVVMAMKDTRAITQLDNISRTKVRGVLALLKHAQMFITHGEEGEAVRLHLIPSISTFKDLRDKHDAFVNRCILQHHLFIPINVKGELIWQLDPETKALRLEELKGLELSLEAFLTTGPGAMVLEPFLAIARSIHIPTSFPPSGPASYGAPTGSPSGSSLSGPSSSSYSTVGVAPGRYGAAPVAPTASYGSQAPVAASYNTAGNPYAQNRGYPGAAAGKESSYYGGGYGDSSNDLSAAADPYYPNRPDKRPYANPADPSALGETSWLGTTGNGVGGQYRSSLPREGGGTYSDSYNTYDSGAAAAGAYGFPRGEPIQSSYGSTTSGSYGNNAFTATGSGYGYTEGSEGNLFVNAASKITPQQPESSSFFFDQADPFISRTYKEELLEDTQAIASEKDWKVVSEESEVRAGDVVPVLEVPSIAVDLPPSSFVAHPVSALPVAEVTAVKQENPPTLNALIDDPVSN